MASYDLVIVGGGPAALAAALFARSKNLRVVMIYEQLGGKTSWHRTLANRPGSAYLPTDELMDVLIRDVNRFPDLVLHDRVLTVTRHEARFQISTDQHGSLSSTAVLIATGATPKTVATPLFREATLGLGYSVTTFAQLVVAQRVAVIGATARSMRGIAELLSSVQHVYLIIEAPTLPDLPFSDVIASHPKVEVLTGATVRDITGMPASSVLIQRGQSQRRLAVERVFVDLGLRPNSSMVQDLVATDEEGFILIDEYNTTSVDGIFAAGDVAASVLGEQVLIALGDGVRAAVSAYEFVLASQLIAHANR